MGHDPNFMPRAPITLLYRIHYPRGSHTLNFETMSLKLILENVYFSMLLV